MPTHDDGKSESRLSRLHYAIGKKSVEYLIVGGYAVGFHAFPRYMGDIDFFVAVSETNALRLIEVFQEFGFGGIGVEKQDFLKPAFIIEIGQ